MGFLYLWNKHAILCLSTLQGINMQIKVTTPVGIYLGRISDTELGSREHTDLVKLIKLVCESGNFFSFDSESAQVFLPKEMIQKSVIEILN